MQWPGRIKPGSVIEEFGMGTDLYPTFLDVTGVKKPDHVKLDGVSLVPLLLQSTAKSRRHLLSTNDSVPRIRSDAAPGSPSVRQHRVIGTTIAEKRILLRDRVCFWLVDYEHPRNTAALVHGYKIITDEQHLPIEVYHVASDPFEKVNLIGSYLKQAQWDLGKAAKSRHMLVDISGVPPGPALLDKIMHAVVPSLQNFSKYGNAANFLYLKRNYGQQRWHNPENHRLVPATAEGIGKCEVPRAASVPMLPFEAADKLSQSHVRPLDFYKQ